jgi:type IV pilus assembly protein PilC
MPLYRYKAINQSGKRVSQTLQADNPAQVAEYLKAHNLFAVEIVDAALHKAKKVQLKTSDKIFFTQNLSVLLSSGISLGPALNAIVQDVTTKSTVNFYTSLIAELEKGAPLSKALAQYPDVFDTVYISLIQAGENSGKLAVVMESLTESLEKDSRMANQVKSAFLYPGFVFSTLILLGIVIVFFVLPRLTKIFADLNVSLPITTRLLIKFGNFVSTQPFTMLAIILSFFAAAGILLRMSRTRLIITNWLIRLPFIKPIVTNLDLSRLSSTLALLLNAGVPIQQALSVAGGVIRNPQLRTEFRECEKKLANGVTLGQAFTASSLPRTFVSLVSLGEEAGSIAQIFTNLAIHYQNLLDVSIKNFTGILEPMLTLIVGLIVGVVVISVMVPMYQFIGNLGSIK